MKQRKPADLLEHDVAKQVSDFMQFRGWRRIRNQVAGTQNLVTGRYIPIGEKGMADLLFIRYTPRERPHSMTLWIETKRNRGGKLSDAQIEWQTAERARGAIVLNVSKFEEFKEWYFDNLGWIHTGDGPPVPGNLDLFAKLPDSG